MTREREDVVKELKDKARDRMEHQVELQDRIYSELGIQVTTCGNCGSVVLIDVNEPYKVGEDGTKLFKCFDCGSVDELCNFPDLYYL